MALMCDILKGRPLQAQHEMLPTQLVERASVVPIG